ncbi:MAG: isopeptide-forming domain-containing fimbrial protein [Aggregatilineales bacterium]
MTFLFVSPVLAEGSRDLYPGGPVGDRSRANLEWTTQTYGPAGLIARRTILNVYMNAGEVLFMGSSAVGIIDGNILVYAPGAITGPIGGETINAPLYDCETQRGLTAEADQGQITSRAMELAGADTDAGGAVAGAYNPCTFTALATGIHSVIFYGPQGATPPNPTGGPTAELDLASATNFNATQNSSIAAWDVTVRNGLNSVTDINGRVFSYYLSFFTGGNGRRVYSTFFPTTLDGYIYRTETNGFDPNGYLVYGNQAGFFDSDGATPLYRDVLSTSPGGFDLASLDGGAGMQRPQYPIFFAQPDPIVLTQLGIPITPVAPIVSNIVFNGSISGNTSLVAAGGVFNFDANVAGVFEIVISRDSVNYDPTVLTNRVLRGNNIAGTNSVNWNGLDNTGGTFPVGTYSVRVNIRAGEYHFPLIDAENSINGGPSYRLINPPGGVCQALVGGCNAGFYDDRGYTTLNGSMVGTVNTPLCGTNPPAIANSDLINGFDTTTTQRGFGGNTGGNTNVTCTGAFGDVKGVDLWTYYPGNAAFANLIIVDTVPPLPATPVPGIASASSGTVPTITKSVNPPFAQPGETVTWTIVVGNPGGTPISNLVVTDTMPAELTVISAVPSSGSATVNGQQIETTIPSLGAGESVTITVTTRVRDNAVVPFILRNQACVTSSANSTPYCASATVLSIAQLPATGQSPYSGTRDLLVMLIGVVAILGTRQLFMRKQAA